MRVSTPFCAGGVTEGGCGLAAALTGGTLAAATGGGVGATFRGGGAAAALRAGFRGAAAALAAGLRAVAGRSFTDLDAFRAAAAAGLRLVSVFFARVACFALFGAFARFAGFELFFGMIPMPPRGTMLQTPAPIRTNSPSVPG